MTVHNCPEPSASQSNSPPPQASRSFLTPSVTFAIDMDGYLFPQALKPCLRHTGIVGWVQDFLKVSFYPLNNIFRLQFSSPAEHSLSKALRFARNWEFKTFRTRASALDNNNMNFSLHARFSAQQSVLTTEKLITESTIYGGRQSFFLAPCTQGVCKIYRDRRWEQRQAKQAVNDSKTQLKYTPQDTFSSFHTST